MENENTNISHVNPAESKPRFETLQQELVNISLGTTTNSVHLINNTCLTLLLLESVSLFLNQAVSSAPSKKNTILEKTYNSASIISTPLPSNLGTFQLTPGIVKDNENNLNREMLYFKLENLGFRVGMGLAERFTLDKELFNDTLDMVKFICKEFWLLLFQKQIDNLKTNHRGVYVLNDNNFKWFQTLSTTDPPAVTARQSIIYTWFPCGLIRGALFGLGINAIVVAEAVTLPQCTFQIRVGKES